MAEVSDFGPRKTALILAIVAGCFAVLFPKIFYPMFTTSVNSHHSTPESSTCCDVIFESDVNTVDIMQEMCQNIMRHHQVDPRVRDVLTLGKLTPQSASLCREEVLARCGIDLSAFLAERERLGISYKQVLEEIRSFNGSLCLKMNFGIPLSQLGTPHLIRYHILMPHNTLKQERRTPPHAGGLHPALRERGRAIPSSHIVPKIQGRPDHVASPIKMRPSMGGAGHVVPAPKGNSTMGIIMPLYTLGIVLFFLYTISKVLRKSSDNEIISNPYPNAEAEKEFQKMVFNPEVFTSAMTGDIMQYQTEHSLSPMEPAPTIEELTEHEAPKSNGLADVGHKLKDEELCDKILELENFEGSSPGEVKVVGMEMTACCENGQKCSRPPTPTIPIHNGHIEQDKTPPVPIYLEGALPSQCELLVTDSNTQTMKEEESAESPVVLSGKMTLSLISIDQIAAGGEEIIETDKLFASPNDLIGSKQIETTSSANKRNDKQMCPEESENEEEGGSEREESEVEVECEFKKADHYEENEEVNDEEDEIEDEIEDETAHQSMAQNNLNTNGEDCEKAKEIEEKEVEKIVEEEEVNEVEEKKVGDEENEEEDGDEKA